MIALDLEGVGLEGVSLAAAGNRRVVGLHEGLEPLAGRGGLIGPLAVVAGEQRMQSWRAARGQRKTGSFMQGSDLMLRALKQTAKLPKVEFLDWLASSEGPLPSASLKALRLGPRTWLAIWLRRAWLRQRFPKPRRRVYVPASQRVKIIALRHYARQHGLVNFVETGTYLGDTAATVASLFSLCFTVEDVARAVHPLS